jgi:hypothetical protein
VREAFDDSKNDFFSFFDHFADIDASWFEMIKNLPVSIFAI